MFLWKNKSCKISTLLRNFINKWTLMLIYNNSRKENKVKNSLNLLKDYQLCCVQINKLLFKAGMTVQTGASCFQTSRSSGWQTLRTPYNQPAHVNAWLVITTIPLIPTNSFFLSIFFTMLWLPLHFLPSAKPILPITNLD